MCSTIFNSKYLDTQTATPSMTTRALLFYKAEKSLKIIRNSRKKFNVNTMRPCEGLESIFYINCLPQEVL